MDKIFVVQQMSKRSVRIRLRPTGIMDKIFVVQQGANSYSYSNVDVATFVFLDEASARFKFEWLRDHVIYGGGGSDDVVWTELHAVTPGSEVNHTTRVDSH